MAVVKLIMTPASAERYGKRKGLTSATRPPDPLLIIESHRRHICEKHSLQSPDVNSDLHRGSNAKDIDLIHVRYVFTLLVYIVVYYDISEMALPQWLVVRLSRQLFRVQA
jgi:hypothetical protein